MFYPDLLIYAAHTVFWWSFLLTRLFTRNSATRAAAQPDGGMVVQRPRTARFSRLVIGVHALAFGVMYFGIGAAVLPNRVPVWFAGQRIVGTAVIFLGAALVSWAVAYFHSWRFRAKLDEGHQLATEGPFRLLRHPIYMGLDLFALGTAIWIPTPIVWTSVVLMAVGGDLRARSEELLLAEAFGSAYSDYRARTRRFLPGIY